MELGEYLGILRRRWLIVAAVTVLVVATSAVLAARGPRAYEATTRLAVSVGTLSPADVALDTTTPYPHFREYYSWLASEYLADDLSEIIRSDAFAADVAAHIGQDVTKGSFQEVVKARKTHRILEVTVQAATPEQAWQLGMAVSNVVEIHGPKYLRQLATPRPIGQVVTIDAPAVRPTTTTGNRLLDITVRGGLGLVVGLMLAFVVDYLDSTLRTAREVERYLGLPVLGEIPSR